MKHHLTISLLFFALPLFAQKKGASPIPNTSIPNTESSTYAVVVGISDYQNDDIPDLRFADKDAEAFVSYLKSPAGGSLPDERLKVLTNQNATTAQIAAALEWLVEVSGEGDKVIIYFSGHGDVETKTMFQLGYLLTWDSPARTYVAGAFPLQYLQAIVSTLALQNKSEVVLITDACRAGKLAGTAVGGAQITNANLSKQFANEIKILSCQPDEFSIEGEQWGGGRGVFSYHLVDGLYGLADNNGDGQVNLFEIGRYLEDKVSTEASPHSQFPMTAGSKTALMTQVNETALTSLKEQRSKETPVLTAIDSKGFEEGILAGIDSVWQEKYEQFVAAVDAGQLLDAPTGQTAAYDLFLELSKAAELKKLHGTMQRNLAAALQDDAQQAINAYLAANPTELGKRYAAESDYGRYPRYLQKAAEILGEENFYYPYVMAKLHYFEGLKLRLDADNDVEGASYQQAIGKQQQALAFQESAPYVLNELGVLHTRMKLGEKATAYYEKAIELAPEWGLPYVNLCLEQFYNNYFEKAIETGDKAIELMPDYPQLYNLLGWVYANYDSHRNKKNWKRKGIELKDDFFYDYDNIGTLSEKKERFERTIWLLQKAIELDSLYAAAQGNLGHIYSQVGELDKGIYHLKKSVAIDSTNHFLFNFLGLALRRIGKYPESASAFEKGIELAKTNDPYYVPLWYNSLGQTYKYWNKGDKALDAYQKAIELNPKYGYPYANSGEVYVIKKEYEKAEWFFLKYRWSYFESLTAYYFLASFYMGLNRFDDAEWMYSQALEIKPDYRRAMINLMGLHQKTGAVEKCNELQNKLLDLAPDDPEILWHIAFKYLRDKDFDKADDYFNKANTKGQENFELNEYFKACFFAIKGEHAKAIEWFSIALDKTYIDDVFFFHLNSDLNNIREAPAFIVLMEKYFPGQVFEGKQAVAENTKPVYYMGNCLLLANFYESQGENERANFLYEKAIALKPDTLTQELALNLTLAYLKLCRIGEAKTVCPDTISADSPREYQDAASTLYMVQKFEQSEVVFQKAVAMDSLPHQSLNYAGWFFKNHGDLERAERYLHDCIETKKDYFPPYSNLALLYLSFDQPEKMMNVLKKGLENIPNHQNLREKEVVLSYFARPPETSKAIFESAAQWKPELLQVWHYLEQLRTGKYADAVKTWKEFEGKVDTWYFVHTYIAALVQNGEMEAGIDLFKKSQPYSLNHQLLSTYPLLEPLRKEQAYREYLLVHFPETTNR